MPLSVVGYLEHLQLANTATDCAQKQGRSCKPRHDDETASFVQTYVEGSEDKASGDSSPTVSITETERKLWEAWDSAKVTHATQPCTDRPCATQPCAKEEVPATDTTIPLQQRREDAQNQLLDFANKAMELYGARSEPPGSPMPSVHSPVSVPTSPRSPVSVPTSPAPDQVRAHQEEQLTIKQLAEDPRDDFSENRERPDPANTASIRRISSLLKHEGVEVLKLGRSNKWQHRYVVLSNDVVWLSKVHPLGVSPCDSGGPAGQCPKALMWLHRRNESRTFGVGKNTKKQGRGGLLFSHMNKIQLVRSESTSASDSFDRIPRKLKRLFPNFFGVAVDYAFDEEDGTSSNRSVMLCFRTQEDAEAFVDTIKILNCIVIREQNFKGGVFHA